MHPKKPIPCLIRSNKALYVPESPGGSAGRVPSGGGGNSPERPLSPPQGQRWPPWAPPPSAPAAAGALRRRHSRRQHRCPGPRRHPPAAGSGTGRGAAGARAPPPARLRPPPSARPAPSPGPRPPPSPCRGTPASTASHRRRLPPPSPQSPRRLRPAPAPAPAPRPCAGPAAGISSTHPAFLFSYAISTTDPGGGCLPENASTQPDVPQYWLSPPGTAPPGAPLSAVSLSTRMGEMKGNPKNTTENTQNRRLFICF